ncbi:VOC family protein [Pokkaliibacter sp. MBI-7]|uniref:VOC family protein n=1 Tax=Pokkaliibacter sp. MBI-7 TaxID=3040600 RepID=UPI002449A58C|nr:VOC family protein [Pokkaliibacter sp. MBI-7]MDH2435371.1 VOC family protein [Pokkaliibacter sp. MBI-7]
MIDHIGINVPDVAEAIGFFHDLLGTRVISDIRPGEIPAAWKTSFNWHHSSELSRFVMLELPGGSKIELFQYEGAEVNRSQPYQDDAGSTHIALRTPDIAKSIGIIRARGLQVLNEPITNADGVKWFYFRTPWGSQMELVSLPHA